jgi:hypothetical protein
LERALEGSALIRSERPEKSTEPKSMPVGARAARGVDDTLLRRVVVSIRRSCVYSRRIDGIPQRGRWRLR